MALTKVSSGLINTSIVDNGNATAITIDSSENVGIGTSSPLAYDTTATTLHVKSGVAEVARFQGQEDADGAEATVRISTSNDRGLYLEGGRTGVVGYGAIGVTDASGNKTQTMFLDASGNVGVGITPETWQSSYNALQIGVGGSITASKTNPSRTYVNANIYQNASNVASYIATDEASQYFQNGGTHIFNVAPSGTADSAISWTTAMTIDNSGNVGIGISSPRTLVNASSATGAILTLESSDTSLTTNGVIGGIDFYSNDSSTNGTGAKVNIRAIGQNTSGTATALTFGTSSSGSSTAVEALRIDASGNVGIGTSVPYSKLSVMDSSNSVLGQAITLGLNNDYRYTFGRNPNTGFLDFTGVNVAGAQYIGYTFNGNVGIGTTTPDRPLEVHKATGGDQTVAKFSAHNYGDTGKTFIEIGTEYGDGSSRIGSFNDTGNKSVLVFDTHDATSGQFTERMRIHSTGVVTMPYQPAFRVDQTGVSSLGVGFNTVAFTDNVTGAFDIGNNFSGNVFTAPVSGSYQFSTSCRVDAMTGYFRIIISKNNSTDTNTNLHSIYGTPASTYENLQVSGVMYLAAGDTARVFIVSSSDTNWMSQGEGHFSGFLIG